MESWGRLEENALPSTALLCLARRLTRCWDLAREGEAREVVAREDTASLGWTEMMAAREAREWRTARLSTGRQ